MIYITKYAGGLRYVLKQLYKFFPPHTTYVEPFSGLGLVLLNKSRSKCEILNDIDGNVVNLFLAIRDNFDEFKKLHKWTLYSREIHDKYYEIWERDRLKSLPPVHRAFAFYYLLATSFHGMVSKNLGAITIPVPCENSERIFDVSFIRLENLIEVFRYFSLIASCFLTGNSHFVRSVST